LTALADSGASPTTAVQRGVAALVAGMGPESSVWLKPVPARTGESVSFDFKLPEDYLGVERTLRIGFPTHFPRQGLQLRIEPSPWLRWPHAMEEQLCLFGFQQRPVSGTPEQIVHDSLRRLQQLLQYVAPGSAASVRQSEFDNEITSYWSHQVHNSLQQLVLLNRPTEARPLSALSDMRQREAVGLDTVWLADDARALDRHWFRLTGKRQPMRAAAVAAFYLPLQTLPPVKIPGPADLFESLRPHVTEDAHSALLTWDSQSNALDRRWLLLQLPDGDPAQIFAWALRGNGTRREKPKTYGRRAGRRGVPAHANASPTALESAPVHVLDRASLHSRDLNPKKGQLAESHVVLVGVGSLGSTVASQLGRAGVGRLTLIDPDRFADANVGRHVLGADELGQLKVHALANRLRHELPTLDVVARPEYAQAALIKYAQDFASANLVVVTTADWPSEIALWEAKLAGASWGLVQGWSEPHAQIGHALFAPAGPADARHLFEATGHFREPFSKWPDGGVRALPGCGASFIPGGPIALGAISTMISHSSLQVLSGAVDQPTWFSSVMNPAGIVSAGGTYHGPPLPQDMSQLVLSRPWK
jgi:hypothetical protein